MPIGSSLGLTLPTPGVTTDWGDDINTALETIAEAVEGQVSADALNINDDISFGDHDITEMGTIQFTNESAGLTGTSDVRKVYTSAGDLYFTDASQNAIRLTAGGALNAASLSGITGAGYGGDTTVNWDSGTDTYQLKSGAGASDYAKVACESVKLSDGSANFLTLDTPSLASDYTITFPAAVPAAAAFLQSDTSGTITFSNTIAQTVTVSDLKLTSNRSQMIHASAGQPSREADDTWAFGAFSASGYRWQTVTNDTYPLIFPITLDIDDRIKEVHIYVTDTANRQLVCTVYSDAYNGNPSSIGTATSNGSGTVIASITGLTTTVANLTSYYLEVAPEAHADDVQVHMVRVVYDRP